MEYFELETPSVIEHLEPLEEVGYSVSRTVSSDCRGTYRGRTCRRSEVAAYRNVTRVTENSVYVEVEYGRRVAFQRTVELDLVEPFEVNVVSEGVFLGNETRAYEVSVVGIGTVVTEHRAERGTYEGELFSS